MTARKRVADLARILADDDRLRGRLLSVIWIGSRSSGRDVHDHSDLDVQIVLDRPDLGATVALSEILPVYLDVDLSVLYVKDVYSDRGVLDFQDGTKGAFFIPVLATGEVVFGEDFYDRLGDGQLDDHSVSASLRFTIREYLARLRVMATQGEKSPFDFKKYALKLLKDMLVYQGGLTLAEMPYASNADLLHIAKSTPLDPGVLGLLQRAADYSTPFDAHQKAVLLHALEQWFDSIDRTSDREA